MVREHKKNKYRESLLEYEKNWKHLGGSAYMVKIWLTKNLPCVQPKLGEIVAIYST